MKILNYTLIALLACCSQSVLAHQFLNLDAMKNSIASGKANIHQLKNNDELLKQNKDRLERELETNHKVWEENKAAIVTHEAKEKSRLEEEYMAQKALYEKAVDDNITNPAMKNQGVMPVRRHHGRAAAE